ncbi:MAG: P-loop NTPase [Coriobacteriia bacterium]|nr:P-loop NTPase [Coriobacteriia bacterium]
MGLIVAIDMDAGFCRRVRAALEGIADARVEELRTLADVSALIELREPDILLIGPSIEAVQALDLCESVARTHPSVTVVLVSADASTDMLRRAMRLGVRDVIPVDKPWAEVSETLIAALAEVVDRTQHPELDGSGKPSTTSRVVTVFSTKGGVGKSIIACNVATALAQAGANVILVDLDLQFGDTGIMLDLKPDRTIFDAVQNYDRLDADMLRGYLVPHKSGLQVLLAPIHPEDADAITVGRIGAILGMLRELADFVVIDTAAAFDEVVLAAIDASDTVYAVATMDVASIKNTRVSLQKLGQLGYDDGCTRLVLNRADSKVWLDAAEVERSISAELVGKVPSDRLVPRSVNRGVPVVIDSPRSAVAKSLVELAERIRTSESEVTGSVT